MVYLLTGLVFWGLAASLFNVRESKRLFTIIGAGDIPAKLLGYLSVPLLAPYIGLPDMIWIMVVLFGIAFLYSKKMFELTRVRDLAIRQEYEHHKHLQQQTLTGKKENGHRLISAIAILSLITFAALILIDFTFFDEVKAKYHTDVELAYFLGLFFAGGRILAALIKFTLSSRFINYVGIAGSLLISPISLLILTIFIIFTHTYFSNGHWLIFLFGAMALFTEILKTTLQEPVFLVLFQPLKVPLRLRGHVIAKGYMLATAMTLMGGFLYLFITYSHVGAGMSLLYILLGMLVVWVVSIFFVKKEYILNLREALQRGYLSGNDLFIEDDETLALLKRKADSDQFAEAVFALDLLEKVNYPKLGQLLVKQLKHQDVSRVNYALAKIVARDDTGATEYLTKELPNIKNPDVAAKFISALYKLSGDDAFLYPYLDSNIPEYQYAAMKGLLRSKDVEMKKVVLKKMNEMAASGKESEKSVVADIIGDSGAKSFEGMLENFLSDPSLKVQNKAIEAAGKIDARELIPLLVDKLVNTRSRKPAMSALAGFRDEAIDYFKSAGKNREDQKEHFIKIAGDIQSDHAFEYLTSLLFRAPSLTSPIVHELWQHHFLAGEQIKPQLSSLVKKRLEEAESIFLLKEGLKSVPDSEICLRALKEEVELRLMDSLKLLGILYTSPKISGALQALIHQREQKSSNALEMLEISIPREIFHKLNHVFEVVYDGRMVTRKQPRGVLSILKEIIQSKAMHFNDWSRAIAMKMMGRIDRDELAHFLNNDPLPFQAAILLETRTAILENRIN